MSTLKKAIIKIYKNNGKNVEEVECAFNPSQYTIKSSANYKEDHSIGTDVSRMIFLSGAQKEFTTTLFFDSEGEVGRAANLREALRSPSKDSSSVKPVTDTMKKITSAVQVSGSDHKPPLVAFVWGNLNFKGVITSVTETFTMFDPFGKPIRGKLDLTIKEAQEEGLTKKTEPFESPDRTKYRTVLEGSSLWSMAYEEYGDCEKWRVIAKANGLLNPLQIYPGQVLKIPALQ